MILPVTIQGTLQSDGSLKLDQAPNLPPGPVVVTVAAGLGAKSDSNGAEQSNDEIAIKERFEKLAARWKAKTKFVSNVTTKILDADYQKIIGMGKDAIPFILNDLADNGPNDWYWALTAITDVNPIKSEMAGNMVAMTEAWLQWGTQAGYRNDYPRTTNKSSRT
ncbi:MAG: hypothetical protein HY289_15495 [Planctomycetes bacterium]|nr:hypothetical protein [Planctomycetota bacterium]